MHVPYRRLHQSSTRGSEFIRDAVFQAIGSCRPRDCFANEFASTGGRRKSHQIRLLHPQLMLTGIAFSVNCYVECIRRTVEWFAG